MRASLSGSIILISLVNICNYRLVIMYRPSERVDALFEGIKFDV